MNKLNMLSLTTVLGLLLSGCIAHGPWADYNSYDEYLAMNGPYYEYYHNNRIHIFYDKKTFEQFKSVGETSFRKTFIGEGPKGETLEFGLTKSDKKKPIDASKVSGVRGPDLFYGHQKTGEDFYAEMWREGKIYVFDNMKDMQPVRQFGEPTYRYTMIGEGPKGETVILVLNKENKKKKPEALIAKFKKHNF